MYSPYWLKGDETVITLTTADHNCVQVRYAGAVIRDGAVTRDFNSFLPKGPPFGK